MKNFIIGFILCFFILIIFFLFSFKKRKNSVLKKKADLQNELKKAKEVVLNGEKLKGDIEKQIDKNNNILNKEKIIIDKDIIDEVIKKAEDFMK